MHLPFSSRTRVALGSMFAGAPCTEVFATAPCTECSFFHSSLASYSRITHYFQSSFLKLRQPLSFQASTNTLFQKKIV
jgi:hypothetical protein